MKKLTLLPFFSNDLSIFLPHMGTAKLPLKFSGTILLKNGLVRLKTSLKALSWPQLEVILLYMPLTIGKSRQPFMT